MSSGPAAKTMDFLKEQKLGLGVGLALGLASMGGAWFGTKQRKKDKDAMIAEARKQICLMEDGSTLDFDELQARASLSHTDPLTPVPCFASYLFPLPALPLISSRLFSLCWPDASLWEARALAGASKHLFSCSRICLMC